MATWSLRRLYASEYLVKDSFKKGDIPPTKEVYGTAIHVAGPSVVEYFLISLIMMADTMMVSTIGPEAIAAVGITTQPRLIVQAIIVAMNVGVTSITARRFGERDHEGAVSCLKQAMVLCGTLSVVSSAAAYAFCRPLLLFAGAQTDTINSAVEYFRILAVGLPASSLTMTISAALRGIGHTRAPMIINMTANIINVVFNYLLIGGNFGFPRLEVQGAAIATVIGWSVGFLIAMFAVIHPNQYFFALNKEGWRFEQRTIHTLVRISSGAFIEQICMRVGFFIYNKMVANLGTMLYATHQIALNIMSLSFSIGEGLSLAAASLVGQNMGAKRPDLSIVYGRSLQRMAMVYCVVLMGVFTFFGRNLIMLFSDVPEILDTGAKIMLMAGVVVMGQASQMIYMGSLRGAGDTMFVAVVSMISIMIVRPLFAYFMAYTMGLGLIGAWTSFILDQYMRLLATYARFTSGKWMSIEL